MWLREGCAVWVLVSPHPCSCYTSSVTAHAALEIGIILSKEREARGGGAAFQRQMARKWYNLYLNADPLGFKLVIHFFIFKVRINIYHSIMGKGLKKMIHVKNFNYT